jgi:DNA-directed RNA polymerase subunit RPC12/RpoP
MSRHRFSVEKLVHYLCVSCEAWWSIGDGPTEGELTCPKCGFKAEVVDPQSPEYWDELARLAGFIP